MERVIGVVSQLRNIRNEKQIPFKTELPLSVRSANQDMYRRYEPVIRKLAHTGPLQLVNEQAPGVAFLVGSDEFFTDLGSNIDMKAERERMSKDLISLQGFLCSVQAKLSTERFVQHARREGVEKE